MDIDDDTLLIGNVEADEASIDLRATLSDFDKSVPFLTPALIAPRFAHDALLLDDGRVLVSGGWTGEGDNNDIFPLPTRLLQIFDPETGLWLMIEPVATPGFLGSAVKLEDGTVLTVIGSPWDDENRADLFDPASGSHESLPGPPSQRVWADLVLLDSGEIMVTGNVDLANPSGYFEADNSVDIEIFDPHTRSWRQVASRTAASADDLFFKLDDGRVMVVRAHTAGGGLRVFLEGEAYTPETHVEMYDPVADAWEHVAGLEQEFLTHDAVLLQDGSLLLVGEVDSSPAARIYEPAAGLWSPAQAMSHLRVNSSLTLLPDGRVLVAGGEDPAWDNYVLYVTTEIYDPETDTWTSGADLSEPRSDHTATLMPDGTVLLVGGIGKSEDPAILKFLESHEALGPFPEVTGQQP